MKKLLPALVALGAAAALAGLPAATAVPTSGKVSFSVEGHQLVATATGLPGGPNLCSFYRSRPGQVPGNSSLGDGYLQVGQKRASAREITIKSKALPAARYAVKMFCTASNGSIVASRESNLRVTKAPQATPAQQVPGQLRPGHPGQR